MMNLSCWNCGLKRLTKLYTYKHLWLCCPFCNNMFSETKEKYPKEAIVSFIYEKIYPIVKKIPKLRGAIGWLSLLMRKEDDKQSYEYYTEETFNESKYKSQYEKFSIILKKLDISVADTSLLDISGEPGKFAFDAKKNFKEVILTTYSSKMALLIQEKTNLNVLGYDFNNDNLHRLLKNKFDFITARYCINFCSSIENFINSIDEVAKKKSYIYLSFLTPSKGTALRYQLSDYVYKHLFNPDSIIKILLKFGYDIKYQCEDGPPINIFSDIKYPEKGIYGYYKSKNHLNNDDLYQYNYIIIAQKR